MEKAAVNSLYPGLLSSPAPRWGMQCCLWLLLTLRDLLMPSEFLI